MSYDDDFGDIFEDFDIFKLIRRSNRELEKIFEQIANGEMKGIWEIRQIDEPEMKGYAIRGQFGQDKSLPPLEPIEPLEPFKRRPSPNRPFELPKAALKEEREALVDVFEEGKALKIYVELPGVDKEDIKLKFGEGCVEVSARNFYKKIALPSERLARHGILTEYKNGVLHITIPKTKQFREQDEKGLKTV